MGLPPVDFEAHEHSGALGLTRVFSSERRPGRSPALPYLLTLKRGESLSLSLGPPASLVTPIRPPLHSSRRLGRMGKCVS